MTNEISEKLFNILLDISKKLEPVSFWMDYTFWISLINVIVLGATLYFLVRYTRATEKMAKYQLMPAVDVNMVYEKSIGKTYFWFSNASNIVAFISINIKTNNENKESQIAPLRIPPNQLRKTATTFDFLKESFSDKTEVILNITAIPAFDNNRIKFHFVKSYRFNQSKFRWDESSWGYPDPSFPITNHKKNN